MFGPIERAVNAVVRPIGNALSTLGDLGSASDEAKKLRRDNAELRTALHRQDDLQRRLNELEKLYDLSQRGRYTTVAAHVVALDTAGLEWTATIDIGSRDKIAKDMTVVNGDGLVGRVTAVGPYTSRVLLAVDATSHVRARVAGSGFYGDLVGAGLDPMRLELYNPDAKITAGTPVLTFGSLFAPGVPIGEVTKVERRPGALTKTLSVRPYVGFTRLDLVGVVVVRPRVDPQDAVLPSPRPTPTPTPSAGATSTASPTPSGGTGRAASPTPSR
ncbi:MAG: rod shape-determining protein MreC [Mycobacteriales bacterium]|nr:rod shape-determining protein MreC [Frankia sp.]